MDIEISIIVCTYNRDKYIYETLARIVQNTFPKELFEIILINNNSTDRTEEECKLFKSDFPQINFHYYIETSQGLSYARNRGIREAKGKTLVFLDDDSFVGKDYLHNLYTQLQTHPDMSAFGGKITPLYESGRTPCWISKWSYSWVSAIDKGNQVSLFEGKSYPIGANMGFKKECFDFAMFNTDLGRSKGNLMGGEEKDIFNALKARKLQIYYFPDIEVHHVIPEQRTTKTYIRKLALGIGQSERIRTLNMSRSSFVKRLFSESIKWAASCILCLGYVLKGVPQKGGILLFFRWYVTRGLLFPTPNPETVRS